MYSTKSFSPFTNKYTTSRQIRIWIPIKKKDLTTIVYIVRVNAISFIFVHSKIKNNDYYHYCK